MATTANSKSVFKQELETLEQVRDELRVQAHLFKADTKKKMVELEKDFQKLKRELRTSSVKRATKESAAEVSEATRRLAKAVRNGMHEIRESLKRK